MKRKGAKGKRTRVVAKVWQCLEVMIYAYSVLYRFLPSELGGGNPDLGSFLVVPSTVISLHFAVKVWRLFKRPMERLQSRIVLKNLPRFARNTLCAALFYMPMLFSVAATADSGMDLPVFAGVILMISACWTFIVFLCDLFILMIHYDPKGKRQGKKPSWWQGYDIRLHDFLDRSWMPLYLVTGGLYAAFLTAEISATLSGVEPPNIQIIVSLAVYITFSILMYRLLFRITCRVYAGNRILGVLLHVFRAFLCGAIIMVAMLASDRRIGDLRHNMDFLLQNMRASLVIGIIMEFMGALYRHKRAQVSPAIQKAPPEAIRDAPALSGRNWFDHLQAKGKALEKEAREYSEASVQPAVPASESGPGAASEGRSVIAVATNIPAQEETKVATASIPSAAQAPVQTTSKDRNVTSGSEGQGWAKVDRWWIDDSAAQGQEARSESGKGGTADAERRIVRPGEVSRGQLVRWLTLVEETLQPQGEALGTLAGQRALFEEAEAILPVLSTLRALPPLARFLFEDATDSEELPERVGALLGGIIDAIHQADLEVINIYWLDLNPEVLVHGWRAISVYRRISTGQAVFDEVLELLEAHLLEREEALNWLCWQCEGVDA